MHAHAEFLINFTSQLEYILIYESVQCTNFTGGNTYSQIYDFSLSDVKIGSGPATGRVNGQVYKLLPRREKQRFPRSRMQEIRGIVLPTP